MKKVVDGNQNLFYSFPVMSNPATLQYLEESFKKTVRNANETFVREGAKHELSIVENNDKSFTLVSTSGTHYFKGTKACCQRRESELLTYAMHG